MPGADVLRRGRFAVYAYRPHRLVGDHKPAFRICLDAFQVSGDLGCKNFISTASLFIVRSFSDAKEHGKTMLRCAERLQIYEVISLTEYMTALGMPQLDNVYAEFLKHKGRDLTGVLSAFCPVHVLRTDAYPVMIDETGSVG